MDATPRQPRGPGRPLRDPEAPDVRQRLIEAAARRIAEQGYSRTSVRAIAEAAGVTPAMIPYYFGDKGGLLEAILDTAFERLLAGVRELAAEGAGADGPFAERFIPLYLRTIGREPWIPQLLVREVLAADTPVRERFVERFARRAAALVPALFEQEIASGRLRADLDPQLTVLSVLGMCVFPFVAVPVVGPVLGVEVDAGFADRLAEHTVRLFVEGAAPREEA